jgi:hypothetical protein
MRVDADAFPNGPVGDSPELRSGAKTPAHGRRSNTGTVIEAHRILELGSRG